MNKLTVYTINLKNKRPVSNKATTPEKKLFNKWISNTSTQRNS